MKSTGITQNDVLFKQTSFSGYVCRFIWKHSTTQPLFRINFIKCQQDMNEMVLYNMYNDSCTKAQSHLKPQSCFPGEMVSKIK